MYSAMGGPVRLVISNSIPSSVSYSTIMHPTSIQIKAHSTCDIPNPHSTQYSLFSKNPFQQAGMNFKLFTFKHRLFKTYASGRSRIKFESIDSYLKFPRIIQLQPQKLPFLNTIQEQHKNTLLDYSHSTATPKSHINHTTGTGTDSTIVPILPSFHPSFL